MTPTSSQVSNWPTVAVHLNEAGSGTVTIGGIQHPITASTVDEARRQALAAVADRAQQLGRPLRAWTEDPSGRWPLIVSPDGSVEEDPTQPAEPAVEEATPPPNTNNGTEPAEVPGGNLQDWITENNHTPGQAQQQQSPVAHSELASHPAHKSGVLPTDPTSNNEQETETRQTRRELRTQRESFLNQEQREQPATEGWRGVLASMGFRIAPSAAEKEQRADRKAVSQHWPGPRTIAIVNGKGGASKTPTTILLSAVFARFGGGGVLAYDNNQTRGTLGWRTEQGAHDATILDLLPKARDLLSTGAQSADLAHYVHHQTTDRYDVLRSKPVALADEQRVNAGDVDAIHQVTSKFYRLIFIDSGNDESDPLWKRMIDLSDQLVVATTTRDEHAEAGALLLEALADRDERSAALADEAVVVVSESNDSARATEAEDVRNGFSKLAREAVSIPYDPAMVDGVLRYDALRANTQRAWLRAAAAVAHGL